MQKIQGLRRGGRLLSQVTHIVVNDFWDLLDKEGADDDVRRVGNGSTDHAVVRKGEFGGDTLTAEVGEVCGYSLRERVDSRDEKEDTPFSDVLWERRKVDEGACWWESHVG